MHRMMQTLAGVAIAGTAALTAGGVVAFAESPTRSQDPSDCVDEAGDPVRCDDGVELVVVPAAPQRSDPQLVAAGPQVVFSSHSAADAIVWASCEAYITSGHVERIFVSNGAVWADLVTEHTGTAWELKLSLTDEAGNGVDYINAWNQPNNPLQILVGTLEPGMTYYAEAIAIDMNGTECLPRTGSFTVPADF